MHLNQTANSFTVEHEDGWNIFSAGRTDNGEIVIDLNTISKPFANYTLDEIKLIIKGLKNLANTIIVHKTPKVR